MSGKMAISLSGVSSEVFLTTVKRKGAKLPRKKKEKSFSEYFMFHPKFAGAAPTNFNAETIRFNPFCDSKRTRSDITTAVHQRNTSILKNGVNELPFSFCILPRYGTHIKNLHEASHMEN
jgi:hypothetical protein